MNQAADSVRDTASVDPIVSPSPHAHSGASVRRIMLDVIVALLPVLAFSIFRFGWDAVRLVSACVGACVIAEWLARKAMQRDRGIGDLSAVVTGLLLAFNLPPTLPTGMAIVGSVVAIVIAKQIFGGIGYNPFNPALIGRVFLLISFPAFMTAWSYWTIPNPIGIDAVTSATPLGLVKTSLAGGQGLPFVFDGQTALQLFLGNQNGCIGEVSGVAILLGGLYMLWRRCITWHIPAAYLFVAVLIAFGYQWAEPARAMPPLFHLLSGGLLLGAVFMATDMVTSPTTRTGMLLFGAGCGVITMVIRLWGGYPEGVSFAILLMNAVTPLINRYTRPRVFGVSR